MENFTSNAQVHANSLKGVLCLCILCFSIQLPAQQKLSTSDKKAQKLYEKADKKYKERNFEEAITLLEEATTRDSEFFEAHIRLGSFYNALGNLDSVYSKFRKYVQSAPDPIASVIERMAHMSFDRGYYEEAKRYLNSFLNKVPEKSSDPEIALLKASIDFSLQEVESGSSIEIQEMPATINRYQLQYLPVLTVDNSTLIYTKRDVFSGDEDIVVSKKKDGQWQPSKSVSERINTPLNEGACTVSADGRTMILTSCDRRDALGSCDLYISKKVGENWSRPKNMGNLINSRYWESQPSLSADGRTLFFASNRPGGYGGRDIWMANQKNGVWEKPKNLGAEVNTSWDETTPFIHFNGINLYFSSNGYPGMGGYDLYETKKLDSTWAAPKNLGYPINTFRDEVAFLVDAKGEQAFFAKEEMKNREILDSRIVTFMLPNSLRPLSSSYLIGKVVDKIDYRPLKAAVEVFDLKKGNLLYSNSSDSVSGEFYMVLPSEKELSGYVKKQGYLFESFTFSTTYSSNLSLDTLLVTLRRVEEGQSLVLNNIYFETNSYELDKKSHAEVVSVFELLQENPTIKVEIEGHTDNVGSKAYNQELSSKRALAVRDALLKLGISPSKVQFKGYGYERPVKPNDTEENRKSNRRIEFRVLRTK
ncbi:MAG: hypothetical protein Tsb0034_28550 [Ekhidna sp.]